MSMTFGEQLYTYRHNCQPRLSQARLGELIGQELGDHGYSGAAVSEWERNKSRIDKDHRSVLVSLLKVLYDHGGMQTLNEANALLLTGNYRALDETEQQQVFSHVMTESEQSASSDLTKLIISFFSFRLEFVYREGIQQWLSDNSSGSPHWTQILLGLLGKITDYLLPGKAIRILAWMIPWLITWYCVYPLMQWPFANQRDVRASTLWFMAGMFIAPLFVGLFTNTRHIPFWKQQTANTRALRLTTYQGAFAGFFVGVMLIFIAKLVTYHLGLSQWPTWFALFITLGPVLLSYAAGRQIPFNHWRMYGTFNLKRDLIFFVFVFAGPVFGLFFGIAHPTLLSRPMGGIALASALILFLLITAWQKDKNGLSIFGWK